MRWPRFPRRRHDAAGGHPPNDPARQRARMVADQLEARGISDPELLRAFSTVERHAFVSEPDPYGDHALPVGAGQTISQPYIVARMTQVARPPGGWEGANVLEVGTGSGYQAAILAEMRANVISIERLEELAEGARQRLGEAGYPQVEVVVGDGTEGWPARGPYRSILVTAGGPSVPKPLLEQLDPDGGRLVMPVGTREHQLLTLIERNGSDLRSTALEPVVFVPLIGRFGVHEG
ncbi:MAG TPA: protein-L-isoaspartate(D-aspartate) O-methyltransferase [Candidatus Limnocylindria bacterium]|nr:protein-L-isoaspartate(D-aspartate) O-methyltransferase [Candidatus Limnocylindria bacterium]